MKCECSDSGCPCCNGQCRNDGSVRLYRIDMYDETGILFCEECAEDAMESGLFTDREDDEDYDE